MGHNRTLVALPNQVGHQAENRRSGTTVGHPLDSVNSHARV
jgi:hypothetical protein